jgi:RHS repeat-associated protein
MRAEALVLAWCLFASSASFAASSSGVDPSSRSNATTNDQPRVEKPYEGDPVGVFTGNAYETAEDLRVACPDLDLVMFRFYSSGSMGEGSLGFGWTHAYDWRVVRDGGKVVVHASGERWPSDSAHMFPLPPPGASVWNADGYELRLSPEGRWTVVTPGALAYAFDASGRLLSMTTWNGTCVAISRDAAGRVVQASHSCGKSLVFEYGADGLLARVSTPDPAVWVEYGHCIHGRYTVLSSAIRHDGVRASTNRYAYSSVPRPGVLSLSPLDFSPVPQRASPRAQARRPVLSWKMDANGVEGSFSYIRPDDSPFAKCARSFLSGGLFDVSLSFGSGFADVESPMAGGVRRTRYTYDRLLRETSRTTGAETLSKTYNEAGDIVRERLSDSSTGAFAETRVSYDARHRAVSGGEGLLAVPTRFATLSWDDRRGIPNRVVSPCGRVREWTADGNEIVVYGAGIADPRNISHVSFDANERPVSVVDPDGGHADFTRNAAGYVTRVEKTGLPSVEFGYDALGRASSFSMPGPGGATRTMSVANNWRGKPLSVTNFDGTAETFSYEGNGRRVTRHVDALGREDVCKWTLGIPIHAGRVIRGVTNNLFGVEHDKQLNVVAITDPLGRSAETYVLDENERVVAVTNVEGQVMTREYLVGDIVSSETRFDGSEVAYGYDTDGNQTSISYPGETLSFSYDGDGQMLSASNSVGAVSNEYDAATGWLTASVGADGTEVSYSRRSGGSVASITSPAGTTSYSFDAAGRRTHIESPSGSFALGYCEWNGKLAAVTNAGGFVVEYKYDIMDRVTNISWKTTSGATLGGFEYEYDAVGRIVSRSHAIGSNAFDRAYAYDDLDRLASDGGVTYTYDAAGNRTTRTESGSTVTYTLGLGDRLASWTGGSYTYDFAGNVTRIERDGRPTLELAWNSQYQLASAATNGVFAESYAYDALGRRVSTTSIEGTTRHVYDDGWQVLADLDANGNVVASYVWGDGIDRLLAVKVGGASYCPLTDMQGTVWGYVDSQNNVVARWRYDAWGNVVDEFVSVPALANVRYRFQCREWSAATGLVNFRMRWYDPETGRWLSKDPIGLSGGLNLYAFCGNTPISLVDAFGLNWWDATKRFGSDAINGYVRGDFIEDPNLANSIGAIAAGFTPIWGQISDARDTMVNVVNVWDHPCDSDAWKALGMCCVGWIPGFGDAAKGGSKLYKGARKAAKSTNRRANKQIDDIAKKFGIDRNRFGEYIHGSKDGVGRGGADNFTWPELEDLAREYKESGRR